MVTLYPFAGYEIEPNGTRIKFIRAGNEILASKQSTTGTDKKLFYHNDHLGGINIVKQFTEGLGGKIEVDSAVGKGSTFTATIPQINDLRRSTNGDSIIL